jgi:hypothetical protein
MDFKLDTYKQLLLSLKNANYLFFTYQDWCEGKADGKCVILRHDIDKLPYNALVIAKVESELGIRASYYFQSKQKIYNPEVIRRIYDLGHEIGYHYNDLVDANGNKEQAIVYFKLNLTQFRSIVPISTIAMHGSPTSKFDNRDLWREFNYKDYDILGEPYFDLLKQEGVYYFTDTARMWDGDKYNVRDKAECLNCSNASELKIHTTSDLIEWTKTKPVTNVIMITTHPQRWTNNIFQWMSEFVMQSLKNVLKRILILYN